MITSGMPNGNKPLHIGHICNFIYSDFYARYMRDRIGADNVLYLCGTDGFGSSTEEKYRKQVEKGEVNLSLTEYITNYHNIQKNTLDAYHISLNRFYASCLEPAFPYHKEVSACIFTKMLNNGGLQKKNTEQFYDEKVGMFLNGRQVEGKCPIADCQSEVGYADECSLGHQYSPKELIDPISTISGTTPIFKPITNYYISLDNYRDEIFAFLNQLKESERTHKFMIKEMRDYLTRPALYLNLDYEHEVDNLNLKYFEKKIDEKKSRIELTFEKVADRDVACDELMNKSIKFACNKTLAPLRITGNASWGVPVPNIEKETEGLTFYVWPESLWAPISFTKAYLDQTNAKTTVKDWWCSSECEITQFLGEDNIYFYCLAQPAIFMAVNGKDNEKKSNLQLSNFVPLKHVLYNGIKASSSGSQKAPTTDELLEHYTYEQLRCHFLSMNVQSSAYQFKSKVFSPQEYANAGDPVVAQGNMLTNIFNRLVRSVLYSGQQFFDGVIPKIKPSQSVIDEAIVTAEKYQQSVFEFKFSEIITLLDEYFRKANQSWATQSKSDDLSVKAQLIADTIHVIKSSIPLLHPIAPEGAELVAKYLKCDERIYDWDNIEKVYFDLYPTIEKFEHLEPKFDFFSKHPSQL